MSAKETPTEMIEDATKTSNQTSLRPARLEDLPVKAGWEYETAGGVRWRFEDISRTDYLCFTNAAGFSRWLRRDDLPWAIEHGLLYCPVEEPKPLECEGRLIRTSAGVTMFMGEAWAGKYVHVGEMREGGKWQWVPDGSTVLGPAAIAAQGTVDNAKVDLIDYDVPDGEYDIFLRRTQEQPR